MFTGAAEGRRLALRTLPQSSCCYVRSQSFVRERPGLRYPRWPSLRSLSQSHRTCNRDEENQSGSSRHTDVRSNSFETAEKHPETDEDDVWSSVIALEASRRKLDWRNQLVTEEQLEFESNASVSCPGGSQQQRLVHVHGADLGLWQELLLYRLRVHGAEGCFLLCKELISASNHHKIRLWELPRMWQALEGLASGSKAIFAQVINHVKLMADIHNDRPDRLYRNIMLLAAKKRGIRLYKWHHLMYEFLPNENELKELLDALWNDTAALKRFKEVLGSMSLSPQMYPWIMSRLVENELYDSIESWHSMMVSMARTPTQFAEFDHFAKGLEQAGKGKLLMAIAQELAQRQCVSAAYWLDRQRKDQDAVLAALANAGGARLSDTFAARLFATELFSIETILQGLKAFHVDFVGPAAFRSAIFRVAEHTKIDMDHVQKTIHLVQAAGIQIEDALYSNLAKLYLDQNDSRKLQYLLTIGPDDLENMKADSERLLREPSHEISVDSAVLLDILALQTSHKPYLTAGTPSGAVRSNYVLRLLLLSDNTQAVKVQVIKMFNDHEEIYENLFEKFWQQLCGTGNSQTELAFQCEVLQLRMQNGFAVSASKWRKLIKALTNEGCMSILESCCSWLVRWAMQSRLTKPAGHQSSDDAPNTADRSTQTNRQSVYLRAIFDGRTTRQLALCGFMEFYHYVWKANPKREGQSLLDRPHADRVKALTNDPALWGISFLKRLHDLGLFRFRSVGWAANACESALLHMFKPMHFPGWNPGQDPYARLKLSRRADLVDYAAACESIWGSRLFERSDSRPPLDRLDQWAHELIVRHCLVIQKYRLDNKPHYLHHATRQYMLSFDRREGSIEASTPTEGKYPRLEGKYWRIARDVGKLPFTRTDVLAAIHLPEYDIGYTNRDVPQASRRIRPVYFDEE